MKTAKITFQPASCLLALLICISSFAMGCQQQTADSAATEPPATPSINQPQKINEPPPKSLTLAEGNGDTLAPANSNAPTAGSTSQGFDSNDQADSLTDANGSDDEDPGGNNDEEAPAAPTIDIPEHWKRLGQTHEIWVDHKNKQVIVGGKICFTAGPLEMLICPKGTKEHETIVSVNAESWQVHAALLAVGAEQGVPSRWVPEYTPAWGPKIDVQMMWRDEKTNTVKTIDGKQWILDNDTEKPMTTEFVFGGSYEEPQMEGGRRRYMADDGELICLANFSTSTIDLRILDPDTDLFFEANTPLIPPMNTQIYTIINPGPTVGKPAP